MDNPQQATVCTTPTPDSRDDMGKQLPHKGDARGDRRQAGAGRSWNLSNWFLALLNEVCCRVILVVALSRLRGTCKPGTDNVHRQLDLSVAVDSSLDAI